MESPKRIDGLEDLLAIQERAARARELGTGGASTRITIHMGTCGIASGAARVLEAARAALAASGRDDIRITTSGCVGLCSQEPLVTIEQAGRESVLYRKIDAATMRELFARHVVEGGVHLEAALARGLVTGEEPPMRKSPLAGLVPHVSELPFFAMQTLWVLRNKGVIDPESIEDYIWREGYQGACKALVAMSPDEILAEVKDSGLRGRGGGGFPTGIKWELCARAAGAEKYALCNADEGDPGAFMDRAVMEGDPHAVIEGMVIAARAIGASQGYIYCRAEYPLAVRRLERAIADARARGLLGRSILGTAFDFDVEVYQGAGAFVCGEETALMRSIEGKRGTPRPRPPYPAVAGLHEKPTVLNNVETYANVPQIILRGGEAYAALGSEESKGTKVFALTGKVKNVGLVEVPMGTPLGQVIFDIGGGIPGLKQFKAVQLGGPSGGCVPAHLLGTPIGYEPIAKLGAIVGSGGMIVMDEDSCMVDIARFFMEFCADESCGKCAPCRIGTRRMLEILERICAGTGRAGDIEMLEELGKTLQETALCGLGQTAPNPVLSTLRYFRSEYEAHVQHRRCPAVACVELFRSPCQGSCPIDTDVPGYIGLIRAGRIDDAYRLLLQSSPFPGVLGRVCGHPCESKCRRSQLDDPLAVMHLKRFAADSARRPRVRPLDFVQKEKVAIIGAGPAGLTAAWELRRRGYPVTVFEALPEAGGMLRWGIPEYRLPRDVLDAEIQDILRTGVELRLGTRIGKDVSFSELRAGYAAVFIGAGAQRSPELGIPGEKADGVYGAVEFLRTLHLGEAPAIGPRVAVIGGGNSAVDAARCARRLGAKEVVILYRRTREEMPAISWEVEAAAKEGVQLAFLVGPAEVLVEEGRVAGLTLLRMRRGAFDRSGRRRPEPVRGSEFTLPIDTVIAAVGQACETDFTRGAQGLAIEGGTIRVDEHRRAGGERVWAGGDVVRGPAMVVDAIRDGRDAARSIDATLRAAAGERPVEPPVEHIEIPFEVEEEPVVTPRVTMPDLPAAERRQNFCEVDLGYSLEAALREASRCRRCDGAACQARELSA